MPDEVREWSDVKKHAARSATCPEATTGVNSSAVSVPTPATDPSPVADPITAVDPATAPIINAS